MQKGRKLWEKVLSLVLAVVCCVGMINLSPLAEDAKAATTITFKAEDSGITADNARIYVIEGNIASGSYQSGNAMTMGTPMTQKSAGEWTASVTSDVITFVRVSPEATGNWYWGWQWENTQRGNNTVYTATANGAGTWSEPEGGSGNFTFTVKDKTATSWINNNDGNGNYAVLYIHDYDTNTEYQMTNVDDNTWTVSIPSSVVNLFIERRSSGGGNWNGWYDLSRGTNTTYYITDNGVGQWTEPSGGSSEDTPSAPTNIYGTPGTSYAYDFDKVELEKMKDTNEQNTLTVVPGIIYNYKTGGGTEWWDQFYNFDMDIIKYYSGSGKMEHPLITGAPDSREAGDNRPLTKLVNNIGMDNEMWYSNHNLSGDGYYNSTGAPVGAPLQGLVAEYLSTDGELLSKSNNVVMPFFDDDFLTGRAKKYGTAENPISFPFRDAGNGYYVFDSASGQDNVVMTDGKLVYNSSSDAQIQNPSENGGGDIGFFPFNTRGGSTDDATHVEYNPGKENSDVNYGFGMRLDIPFTVDKGDKNASTPIVSTSATINNGNPNWMEMKLGYTLQPGTYNLVLKRNGGAFAITQYKAGNSGSGQPIEYFTNHKDTSVGGYESFGDIDGGREALKNLSGSIILPITVTEATDTISVYGKTWGDAPFGVSVYDGSSTPVISNDTVFNFSGDDDLWVYVDGRLALDVGGSHGRATGSINFTTGEVTVADAKKINGSDQLVDGETYALKDWLKLEDDGKVHTLTVFYMERGLYDSNLKIEFNFTPVDLTQKNGITVSNEVDLSEINKGFLSNLSVNDFSFRYDAFDVNEFGSTGNKGLLFANGEIVITGNGSQTASLDQDTEDGTGTIRGDEIKVTQDKYQNFDTSYTLTDTNGHEIMTSGKSGNDNPYNVVDGRTDKDSTADNYFYLENKVGCDCPNGAEDNLHLTAAYVNKAKATNITIGKKDNSVAHVEADTYTFSVTYSKLLGVEKTGFFNGEYTVTDTRNNTVRTETTANGEITIHEYEVVTIAGVPVDSEIKISEKNDGNFKQTIVTPSSGTESTIGNNIYFPIGSSSDVSYNWQIVNGDAGSEEYFAEVGTPIEINDGDEISLAPTGSKTTDEFTYMEEIYHPETTGTQTVTDANGSVTIPNDSGSYHDYTINLGTTLKAGQTYTVKLSGTKGGAIMIQNVKIDGSTFVYGDSALTTEGDIATDTDPAIGNATVIKSINGSLIYTVTPSQDTSNVVLNLKTWDAWPMDYEVSHVEEGEKQEAWTEYVPHVVTGVEYSYHEVISASGTNDSTKGTVSNTDTAITYTYPVSEEPGTDNIYYVVSRIADADVVVEGNTVIKAGDVISTKTVPATIYAYQVNDDLYVIDYGLTLNLTDEPNNMKANDTTMLTSVATELKEYGFAGKNSVLGSAAVDTGVYTKDTIGYITKGSTAYAEADAADYTYKLNKFLDAADTFYYGVQVVASGTDVNTAKLNAANATPVMNSKVTVVPASVVYYEDNFSYDSASGTTTAITYTGSGVVVNSTGLDITQSNSLDELYGFDKAYENMTGDSNGSTVLAKSQKVSFKFKGTGFDIVARTADTASVLYVVSRDNKVVEMGNVDTYYDNGTLYQLPVISVKDLDYGEYTVTFMIASSSSYSSFYFDGIRIYNPLNDEDAKEYYNSNEYNADVQSIRSLILGDCTFTETEILDADGNAVETAKTTAPGSKLTVVDSNKKAGSVITEDIGEISAKSTALLADILSVGPNNEVYLGSGSALAFYVKPDASVPVSDRTLQVEVKAVGTAANNNIPTGDIDNTDWTITAFNVSEAGTAALTAKLTDGVIPLTQNEGLGSDSYRWTSYSKTANQGAWLQLDMGKVNVFDQIQLAMGGSTNDFPDTYEIYVSRTGEEGDWTLVKSGNGASGVDTYSVGRQYARYIKVVMPTATNTNYWSVYEFVVSNTGEVSTSGSLTLTRNSSKDFIANVNTNTAMYYNIPLDEANKQADGSYLVVINGDSTDTANLSFTNLKVKGYELTPYKAEASALSDIHITDVTVNGKSNISFERKSEVNFEVTLSADADLNNDNFALTANGKDVSIRSIEAKEGSSNIYIVKTLAPNAVGTFTYKFAYTNQNGNVAVTSVAAKVTAGKGFR